MNLLNTSHLRNGNNNNNNNRQHFLFCPCFLPCFPLIFPFLHPLFIRITIPSFFFSMPFCFIFLHTTFFSSFLSYLPSTCLSLPAAFLPFLPYSPSFLLSHPIPSPSLCLFIRITFYSFVLSFAYFSSQFPWRSQPSVQGGICLVVTKNLGGGAKIRETFI